MIKNVQGSTKPILNYELKEKQPNLQEELLPEEDKAAYFEKNKVQESITYSRPKTKIADHKEVNRLLAEAEKSYQGLQELVQRLMAKQGKRFEDLLSGKENLEIDDETRINAQAAIAEDGEWGINAVSDRLVAFAKAVSGNDKSKFGEIKSAIEKGFKEAERIFGGSLPEISYKTYDETMRKLDEWANSQE